MLRTWPAVKNLDFEFSDSAGYARNDRKTILQTWQAGSASHSERPRPELLIEARATLDEDAFNRLPGQRDNKPMGLLE